MIEVPEIGAPRPASHLHSSFAADVVEGAVARIAIEGVSAGVALIERADALGRLFMKLLLPGNPLAGGLPHAWNVNILAPIVVVVGPAATHARAHALHVSFLRSHGKCPVAVVSV